MKPSIELDLGDMVEILEDFQKKLDTMPLKDQIDLAARLKPALKSLEGIDKAVKEIVKVKLKHEEGSLRGNLFKAVLKIVPVDRLDQTRLKEERPTIHAQYLKGYEDERVTFELR